MRSGQLSVRLLLIVLLLLPQIQSVRYPKIHRGLKAASGSGLHNRKAMSVSFYSMVRRGMVYWWGRQSFKRLQQSVFNHVIQYGTYYIALYNLVYLLLFAKKYLEDLQHKEQKLQTMVSTYQSKYKSTADEQESFFPEIETVLKQNLWVLQQRAYSSLEVLRTEIHVWKIVYTADSKYKILMNGYDSLGKSELKGVLTVATDQVELKMVKEYDDYCEFVSSELWTEVQFEGQADHQLQWQGQWCIMDQDSRRDPECSGVWRMKRQALAIC